MARTVLPVSPTAQRGSDLNFSAADTVNGNAFPNDGSVGLIVQNNTVSPVTVTLRIPSTSTFDGIPVPDRTEAVPPGALYFFGRLPSGKYNQAVDASVYFDVSGPCQVAVFQIDSSD